MVLQFSKFLVLKTRHPGIALSYHLWLLAVRDVSEAQHHIRTSVVLCGFWYQSFERNLREEGIFGILSFGELFRSIQECHAGKI